MKSHGRGGWRLFPPWYLRVLKLLNTRFQFVYSLSHNLDFGLFLSRQVLTVFCFAIHITLMADRSIAITSLCEKKNRRLKTRFLKKNKGQSSTVPFFFCGRSRMQSLDVDSVCFLSDDCLVRLTLFDITVVAKISEGRSSSLSSFYISSHPFRRK